MARGLSSHARLTECVASHLPPGPHAVAGSREKFHPKLTAGIRRRFEPIHARLGPHVRVSSVLEDDLDPHPGFPVPVEDTAKTGFALQPPPVGIRLLTDRGSDGERKKNAQPETERHGRTVTQ